MQIKAKAKYIHMSPKKVRLVLGVIRGMDAGEAEDQLKFIPKRACKPILKLLNSAVANAKENYNLEKENLFIKEIRADEGPTLHRWMPKAHGKADPIRKRSSHISIILDQKPDSLKSTKLQKITKARKEESKTKKIEKPIKIKERPKEKGTIIEEIKPTEVSKETKEEHKVEPKDVRREAGHRWKGHLDKLRMKGVGGMAKRIFRRKAG